MGTAIVNDDGAIRIIPLGVPGMKEYPVTIINDDNHNSTNNN